MVQSTLGLGGDLESSHGSKFRLWKVPRRFPEGVLDFTWHIHFFQDIFTDFTLHINTQEVKENFLTSFFGNQALVG